MREKRGKEMKYQTTRSRIPLVDERELNNGLWVLIGMLIIGGIVLGVIGWGAHLAAMEGNEMPRYQVQFSNNREPEVLTVDNELEVMPALCEIYGLESPLIPSRMKGIQEVWLMGENGKLKRRVWP